MHNTNHAAIILGLVWGIALLVPMTIWAYGDDTPQQPATITMEVAR